MSAVTVSSLSNYQVTRLLWPITSRLWAVAGAGGVRVRVRGV